MRDAALQGKGALLDTIVKLMRRPRDRTISPRRLRWPCRPADPCKPAPALWSGRPSRPARRQRGGRVGLRMPQAKGTQAARGGGNFASTQALDHLAARSRCAAPFFAWLRPRRRTAPRPHPVPLRILPSLDHLVGAGREPHWHVDTQRPGGLEIEHEFELDGLDHGQLAWLIASKNAGDVDARLPIRIGHAGAIA